MGRGMHRRDFLRGVAAAGAAASFGPRSWGRPAAGPNEKLNIGVIGTSGRALGNIEGVEGENIVAVCDVDSHLLGIASERFPKARIHGDFRKMIEAGGLDAVVISTPDHTHAPAAAMALRMGKHVYCEKPLTHSVFEARAVARLAAEAKVATQMGTQIHATSNYRRVVELIRSGAIGPVRSVNVWLDGAKWAGGERPTETPAVPSSLDWDAWLGPAPTRPYHPTYQPANWRRWWDFGNGTLGDMACHYMDLPFWALDLHHPLTVESPGGPAHAETTPVGQLVRWTFPPRGEMPAVELTWRDGLSSRPEALAEHKVRGFASGVLFTGDRGMLAADYDRGVLLPEPDYRDFVAPARSIPDSIGHHAEWIAACKDGRPTTCDFDYSGALTEAVLLGNVAFRVGRKLDWDAAKLRAVGCPEAENFLRREYREGWTL